MDDSAENNQQLLNDYFSIKNYLKEKNEEINSFSEIENIDFENNINNKHFFKDLKIMKNNLLKEKSKLQFCLNNIKGKYDEEIKIKLNNINEQTIQIKENLNNIKENNILIEKLKLKIEKYEKIINDIKDNKTINYNLIELIKENKNLKEDIDNKDELIEYIKDKINNKKELLIEINKIKIEINNIEKEIEKFNNENKEKDKIIKALKNSNIKKDKDNSKNNDIPKIKEELKKNKEKEEIMKKEYEDIKSKLLEEKNKKEKLNELSKNADLLLKNSIEAKEKLKKEYDTRILNIKKEYNEKLKLINNNKEDFIVNEENKIIFQENENNKIENEELIKKIDDLSCLENKYKELYKIFTKLKEENLLLKKENKNISKNQKLKFENKDIKKESNITNEDLTNLVYNKKKPKQMNLSKEKQKNVGMLLNNNNHDYNYEELNINEKDIIYNKPKRTIINKNDDNINNDNSINESFNLYKPIKEGLLTFNISKKSFNLVIPENHNIFWNNFDPENSMQYNTLEGLFILNSKDNQLYYYSSKKNLFCELLYFNYDHKEGCLFLDNLSKNIIVIGGINTTKVEKFSFENGTMEELPELSTHRYKMSCCQIANKIYCFFGLSLERKNQSLIEYLDMVNINIGWKEIKYENKTSFNILSYMSCVNLNDCELLIIGGLIEDNLPNQKLLYFNTQKNEFIELNKDLPDSDIKKYLFSKNIMFNLFVKENTIYFTNIDDNNQVHILDNDLKYDLYLAPNLK